MTTEILQEGIVSLTKSRDVFRSYVKKSHERLTDFPNSSYYFHKKVIDMIRTSDYDELLSNDLFFEFVYATLSSWGLDRMDGGARLEEFIVFRKCVLDSSDFLRNLCKARLNKLDDKEREETKSKLAVLFDKLGGVMKTESKLVGVSKTMHHLLPDLVPPIDRKHTETFFYGRPVNRAQEKKAFLELFDCFHLICKKLNLSERDLEEKWDTSIPKLIDNAIIGYVKEKLQDKG
ncbi:MAG: hypothetical protein WED05_05705 [Candidatus Atabeyarchaeum deiterrae]